MPALKSVSILLLLWAVWRPMVLKVQDRRLELPVMKRT